MEHRILSVTNKLHLKVKEDRAVCLLFALIFLEHGICLLTDRDILQECTVSVTQHPSHSFSSQLTVQRTTYTHTRATDSSLLLHIYHLLFLFLPPTYFCIFPSKCSEILFTKLLMATPP